MLRPLAVEAAVAGMGMLEEGRRLAAEQMETLEDIVAEARARREEQLLAETNGHHLEPEMAVADEEADRGGARRRANGGRRRAS
ncbi:MAG TPA: DUF5132 domain-containing protein [Gaiellaceae bacterium]|nr:DUF5132 domain-containing protein [Gaiellaceae bacterium]